MSGIKGVSFKEHGNLQAAGSQAAARPLPVDKTQQAAVPGGSPYAAAMELLNDKIGPAYKLAGVLPEVANGGAAKAEENLNETEIAMLKRTGQIECQTCANRTYQDGSNDPGVSFKAPGHISPEASFATVASHENEHVVNEQAKAKGDNRRVLSQSVQVFMATCPECGKAYASGGVTKTTTAAEKPAQNEEVNPENKK